MAGPIYAPPLGLVDASHLQLDAGRLHPGSDADVEDPFLADASRSQLDAGPKGG